MSSADTATATGTDDASSSSASSEPPSNTDDGHIAICSLCRRPITAKYAYRCQSSKHKEPFDICEVCFKRDKHKVGEGRHSPSHKFKRRKVSLPARPKLNFHCDLCNKQIKGIRYECDDCPNFDVCKTCFKSHSTVLARETKAVAKARAKRAATEKKTGRSIRIPDADYARENHILSHGPQHALTPFREGELSPHRQRLQKRLYERWSALTEDTQMLHVRVLINDVPLDAMVDTGAQMTVLSAHLAGLAHLTDEIDTEFAGLAVGVGTATIMGRVIDCPMRIANREYVCSIAVIDNPGVGFLLGLDFLKRNKASVIVADRAIQIGRHKVRCLEEHELLEREMPSHFAGGGGGAAPPGCPIQ